MDRGYGELVKTCNLTDLDSGVDYNVRVTAVGDGLTYIDSSPSTTTTFTTLGELSPPVINFTIFNDFASIAPFSLDVAVEDTIVDV